MNTEAKRISTVDTAKLIRRDLAEFFPSVKFSVTTKHYGSIDIHWTDGPTTKSVDAVVKFYQCASFDGMTDSTSYFNRHVKGEEVHFAANYVMAQRTESNEFIAAMLPLVCKKYGADLPQIRYENGRICVWDWDNGPACGRDTLRDLVMQAVYATDARLLDTPTSPADKFRTMAETVQTEIDEKRRGHDWNLTARRANIEAGQGADARQLEKLQDKLRAIAAKWEAGYIDESLRRVNTRVLVDALLGGHFPDPHTQSADYKRLIAAGLGNEDAFRHAAFELSLLGDAEIGKRTANDELRDLEVKVTLAKIDGFFPTPADLAQRLVEQADIEEGMSVLEPSAGKGDIAALIPGCDVIEANHDLRKILEVKGFNLLFLCYDFLEFTGEYDRIVMNPPFENMQDVDHVMHAYTCLADGGRIVAIMSESPFFRNEKKAVEFRAWLYSAGGTSKKLPEGTFLDGDRPTGVNTRLVIIDKPAAIKETEAKQQELPIMQEQPAVKILPRESDAQTVDTAEVAIIREAIDKRFKLISILLNDALPLVDNKAKIYRDALAYAYEIWGMYFAASAITAGNFIYTDLQVRAQAVIDTCWAALSNVA